MAETYSYSKLETFGQCGLKYKYQYLDRLEGDRETIEAFMGSRVHETLEKLYKDLGVTKLNTIDQLFAYYDAQWEKNWHDQVVVVRAEYTADQYRELGRQCLRDYYKRFHPFDDGKTLGLEDKFNITLKSGDLEYRFTGVIDRLVWKGEGMYEIHDYKTGRTPPTQASFDENKQLAIYHMSLTQRWPDVRQVKLIWHYVALDKDFVSTREATDLEALSRELVDRIQQIESTREFKPQPSALCGWCEYRSICPLWKHEAQVSALTPEQYAKEDGVKLVTQYITLLHEREAHQKQIEAVEAAIYAYAQQFGVAQLDGPEHRVRIWMEEELAAPYKKDDPVGWEKLRQLIVGAGKYQDVSTINSRMLTYQLDRGGWPKALRDQVQALMKPQLKKQLRVTKKIL